MSIEEISLGGGQADIATYFRITAVYRSDTTRALDKMYNLDGTPQSVDHVHRYRLGYESTEAELVVPVFIKLAGKVGHFCGIKMDEVPRERRGYVERTIRDGWLQMYEHGSVTVVEPSMKFAEEDVAVKR